WHIWPDVLTYFTWSQGFRAGAFNRSFACYLPDASGVPQYCSPLPYASDNLTNDEFGWKTEFLDHRLQWNGAIYKDDWKDVRSSGQSEQFCATVSVQCAAALSVGDELVKPVRAGGRDTHRTFVHSIRQQPGAVCRLKHKHKSA